MKKIFKLIFLIVVGTSVSCNEDDFLKEEPLDFYTPDNSLSTGPQFQSSINFLHNRLRNIAFGGIDLDAYFALRYATDFAVNATDYSPAVKLNDYKNTMVPTFGVPQTIWSSVYQIISNANVVISRAPLSTKLSDNEKKSFTAQALFFRAWGYNMLGNLFGGVPLILEEISVPRRDFVRASREEVYTQCKKDLLLAIESLPNIDESKDGVVNKQAAQHILSEVLISLKAYDEAVAMATQVIDYPAVGLMTQRFGSHKDKPGDVFRDLFELGNQNRTSGNREGLYVIQSDYLNPASTQRDAMQWAVMPLMQSLTIKSAVDGKSVSAIKGLNEKWSGRGVGWMKPTSFFLYTIWQNSDGDIRNSEYNIIRDFQIDGVPSTSPDFGKWYVKDGYKAKVTAFADTIRNWFPIIRKNTISAGDFPDAYISKDASGNALTSPLGGRLLLNASQDLFRDNYLIRLAETYLLRAEANVMKGNMANAAADINLIRARAKAPEVAASQMDIDFILDERMRELYSEEFRMVTLTRMGKLYDRDKKYNEKSGLTIEPYHNLWPIPFAEINRNVYATLEQNPGYTN